MKKLYDEMNAGKSIISRVAATINGEIDDEFEPAAFRAVTDEYCVSYYHRVNSLKNPVIEVYNFENESFKTMDILEINDENFDSVVNESIHFVINTIKS